MKTKYLHNKSKRGKKLALLGVFVAFFLISLLFGSFARMMAKSALFLSQPFLKYSVSLRDWSDEKNRFFEDQEILVKENTDLKNKLNELETKFLSFEVLEKENKEIKEIIGHPDFSQYKIGFILSRPPISPYDILIIDIGSEQGIQKGMTVMAYGNILIGYAEEVFKNTSKVKLISFPKSEINAVALSSNIPVMVYGRGGENMGVDLPKDIDIKEGERIVTVDDNPLLIGIVEKIQTNEADPFKKLLLRIPLNLQELRYVIVKI